MLNQTWTTFMGFWIINSFSPFFFSIRLIRFFTEIQWHGKRNCSVPISIKFLQRYSTKLCVRRYNEFHEIKYIISPPYFLFFVLNRVPTTNNFHIKTFISGYESTTSNAVISRPWRNERSTIQSFPVLSRNERLLSPKKDLSFESRHRPITNFAHVRR